MSEKKENSNLDLSKEPQYNQEAQNEPIPENGPMFFNIMPKSTGEEKFIEPTIKIKPEPIASRGSFMNNFVKNKLYIYSILAILILGPVIYFLISKFVASSIPQNDNLLTQNLPKKKPTPKDPAKQNQNLTTSKEWQLKYWGKEICQDENLCGDSTDPDLDGLKNLEEFQKNTDPNNKDSDGDGLSDGDEIHVFATDPLKSHSSGNEKYSDADDIKNGYANSKIMTAELLEQIAKNMETFGLNQPTLTTLGIGPLTKLYHFSPDAKLLPPNPKNTATSSAVSSSSTLPSTFDASLEAKQERDTQRIDTIKKIQIALVAYFKANNSYPNTRNFKSMYALIKPHLGGVATNPDDPVNLDPFLYSYTSNEKADDFVITFYSEVAGQLIKKSASDAQKESNNKSASFNDSTRKNDLETLRQALLIFSQKEISGSQEYVFPTEEDYKKDLVPEFISQIPKDPKTSTDYEYKVSETFDTFTLKAILDNPKDGTTGYLCNQEECREY